MVLDVKESGPVYLSVHQPEKRLQPDGYEYNKIGFTLIKQISDSDFAHVDNSPIHQTAQVGREEEGIRTHGACMLLSKLLCRLMENMRAGDGEIRPRGGSVLGDSAYARLQGLVELHRGG